MPTEAGIQHRRTIAELPEGAPERVPQHRERILIVGFHKGDPDQTPQRLRHVAPASI